MMPLALVTGATGGIGSVIVQRLLREGYDVIACGRNQAKLDVLRVTHTSILSTPCFDVRQSLDAWQSTITATAEAFGVPDLLVIAHGAAPLPVATIDLTEAQAREVWDTDVWGTFAACKTVGRFMLDAGHGCIVIVSSLHARQTYPSRVPYATAKSALSGMARALAVEWGRHKIRTNVLLPWQVRGERSTQMAETLREETGEDLLELYRQRSPMRRLLEPEDIAHAVVCCAQNPALNGAEIVLDGGVSQSMWYQGYKES